MTVMIYYCKDCGTGMVYCKDCGRVLDASSFELEWKDETGMCIDCFKQAIEDMATLND